MKRSRHSRSRKAPSVLTTPDLVLLSLLAERPMHGYHINEVLEARNIRHWASVSRPQIYYSLDKLTAEGLVARGRDGAVAAGPERRVYRTTKMGRRRLSDALCSEDWTTDRTRPAFLTWLALSWQAPPGCFEQQASRRRAFLESALAAERATLVDVFKDVGHPFHEAVWMLQLTIAEMETELQWLSTVVANASKRQPARRPASADGDPSDSRRTSV